MNDIATSCNLDRVIAHHNETCKLITLRDEYDKTARETANNLYNGVTLGRSASGHNQNTTSEDITACAWGYVLERSGLWSLMSHKQRDSWSKTLLHDDLPPFTHDNVHNTFTELYARRFDMIIDAVEEVFKHLSWSHKTNDPRALSKRIIFSQMTSASGLGFRAKCLLDDLERCCLQVLELPFPSHERTLGSLLSKACDTVRKTVAFYDTFQCEYDCDLFHIQTYKKGTAHITFKNPEALAGLNRLLALRYPTALAQHRPKNTDGLTGTELVRWTDTLVFDGLPSAPAYIEHTVQAVPANKLAPYLNAKEQDRLSNHYKGLTAHGHFPTPEPVIRQMIDLYEQYARGDAGEARILEPSAGLGFLARAVWKRGHDCAVVEYNRDLYEHLHDVIGVPSEARYRGDFLSCHPRHFSHEFDAVLMNPPFERIKGLGWQALRHVRHSAHFVRAGGLIVAVMPRGWDGHQDKLTQRFVEWAKPLTQEHLHLPARSFSKAYNNTDVDTDLIVLRMPEDA